jgi:hypothetical protein
MFRLTGSKLWRIAYRHELSVVPIDANRIISVGM